MSINDQTNIHEQDRIRLLIMGVIFMVFVAGYGAYSVGKYKTLQVRSLIAGNVVMKVIAHNVYSVCPICGTKGIPLCPTCKVAMFWNGYRGIFVCPACGKGGFPLCPHCGRPMTWIETQ
ncbi:MAG: hypothetical protein HQL19_00660 [Candidatus Omnitrophica bacterium]|nr:hypothetical protein [Candidatus Omnitrophota bacterium]